MERKHGVDVVRKGFVLILGQIYSVSRRESLTITNLPDRLIQVTSGGAAMTAIGAMELSSGEMEWKISKSELGYEHSERYGG